MALFGVPCSWDQCQVAHLQPPTVCKNRCWSLVFEKLEVKDSLTSITSMVVVLPLKYSILENRSILKLIDAART